MGLNWSKGLIAAGSGLKEYSAIKAKEEYLAAASKTATDTAQMESNKFLYEDAGDQLKSLYKWKQGYNQFGLQLSVSPSDEAKIDNAIYGLQLIRNGLYDSIAGIAPITKEKQKENQATMEKIQKLLLNWSASGQEKTIDKGLTRPSKHPSGDPRIGPPNREEKKAVIQRWYEENGIFEWLDNSVESMKRLYESLPSWLQKDKVLAKQVAKEALESRKATEETFASGDEIIGESADISSGSHGVIDEKGGGSGVLDKDFYEEITPTNLTQKQIEDRDAWNAGQAEFNKYIGSPEALDSLANVGLKTTNIPQESEAIEMDKHGLRNSLAALIAFAEARVHGYNSVAGSKEADPDITRMTVGEIKEKYGNKGVGIGQFQYDFISDVANRYLDIKEKELKDIVLSKSFQDQLITLGLEKAGITLFLKGEISQKEFMEKLWGIWRGLGKDKESLPGDSSDEYGNKVNLGGGLIDQVLGRY